MNTRAELEAQIAHLRRLIAACPREEDPRIARFEERLARAQAALGRETT